MAHQQPVSGKECLASFEEIDETNYVEYQTLPSGTWHACNYSQETVEHLLESSYKMYLGDIEKASKDCAAAVRRLVTKGPPLYLSDCNHGDAIPVPEGDTHVDKFWFMNGNVTVSGVLPDAAQGDARAALWASQRETLAAMEASEAT
ncbi:hypothetical protein BASA81_000135 [Batrachochytrium salamandrivorans]|nr:hypothetical protein BASA81_000135 [Batrachochytrium salamandrivorans]